MAAFLRLMSGLVKILKAESIAQKSASSHLREADRPVLAVSVEKGGGSALWEGEDVFHMRSQGAVHCEQLLPRVSSHSEGKVSAGKTN